MRNRRQASASRICEGSLYIALRLIRVIPARRLSCPAASRIIRHDRFGARRVRFPVFFRAKAWELNKAPPPPRAGMRWRSAASVFHTFTLAPLAGRTGLRQHMAPGAESSDVKHVHVRVEELLLPQRRADVVLDRPGGGGGCPALSSSLSFAGERAGRGPAAGRHRSRLGPRAQRRVNTARHLAGHIRQDSARPSGQLRNHHRPPQEHSQNRSLPTAVSMLSPMPALPQPSGVRPRRQQRGARPGACGCGIAGYLLLWIWSRRPGN